MQSTTLVRKLKTAVRHHQSGDVTTALGLYAEVLRTDPGNADAWHLSGLAAHQRGDEKQAETLIRYALELSPQQSEFKANLAAVLVNQKRSVETEKLCRDILHRNSRHVAALTHLGTALRQQGRLNESLLAFQTANQQNEDANSLCNLGAVLVDLGNVAEALQVLEKAIELAPEQAQVILNLATVHRHLGNREAAFQMLEKAERLQPASCEVQVNKANLLLESGRLHEAIEASKKAIEFDPRRPSAVSCLAIALQQLGYWEDSLKAHSLAAQLDPSDQRFQSSYLYGVTLSPLLNSKEVVRRHADWGRQIEAATSVMPLKVRNFQPVDSCTLRIGYVSPDLHQHATMRFLLPMLQAHDQSKFSIYCYSESSVEDGMTERVKQLSSGWCRTRGLSNTNLAERIQHDQIDILVDLAGHTRNNRLPVFAMKPAPVQASFLGYPNTTGLSRIDYFLTDAIRAADDADSSFTETPFVLPHGSCCYRAALSPEVSSSPCLRNGYVTLGSTHRLEKLSPQTWQLWAEVLAALPTARLFLIRDTLSSENQRQQVFIAARNAGISHDRIRLAWDLPDPYLQIYSEIDILLDVFPWGSGTIAYDAMWMGVPIPSIIGDRPGCRATASLMHHSGFPELVAADSVQYLDIVTKLATDTHRLSCLRSQIRPAMQRTVCDQQQFAADVEAAYRKMWKAYVTRSSTDPRGSA